MAKKAARAAPDMDCFIIELEEHALLDKHIFLHPTQRPGNRNRVKPGIQSLKSGENSYI